MREIEAEEVYKLENCLQKLADHHNNVSVNFKGYYPKRPFEETIIIFASEQITSSLSG